MSKINYYIIFPILLIQTSCVTTQVYDKVNKENRILKSENKILQEQNHKWGLQSKEYKTRYNISLSIIDSLKREIALLKSSYGALENNHSSLKESYDALLNSNNKAISENARKNRLLLEELEIKEKELKEKEYTLEKLKEELNKKEKELDERGERIDELKKLIEEKENVLTRLKENLKKALSGFKDKGLEVIQKNGKIYVLLENKLLFKSGSYNVQGEGVKAINELGKVLSEHKDISVLIEGHTDNVPYKGKGQIKDNWDLSVVRATSVVKILFKNKNIDKKQITPAGRGDIMPKVPNDSSKNRAINRRIEIIITPDFSKIESLIENK